MIISIINYGTLSRINEITPAFRMWMEDRSNEGIYFPQFQVSSQDKALHFSFFDCSFYSKIVSVKNCPGGVKDCKIIDSNLIMATKGITGIKDNITCIILLQYDKGVNMTNSAIRWDIIESLSMGTHQLSTFIDPDDDASILLKKDVYYLSKNNNGNRIEWNPRSLYFNNIVEPNAMVVNIVMSSFLVSHYQNYDFYSGWLAFADAGGTLFIIYAIHSLIMILIGCVIKNDATTLGGTSHTNEGNLI